MSSTRKNDEVVRSIRRESFIFGIQEVEEDARTDGSIDINERISSSSQRGSLTIDDIDIDLTRKQSNGAGMDVSLLESFTGTMEIDASQGPQLYPSNRKSQASARQSSDIASRQNCQDIFEGDSSIGSTASNHAGGSTRRKGDKQRRMRQRMGVRDSFGDHRRTSTDSRRASTGTIERQSVQESFGDMSLQSFTSMNSFSMSTSGGGNESKFLEVGNLVFVTDAEMEKLMYGDDNDANTNRSNSNEDTVSSMENNSGSASRRRSSDASSASELSNSLPPSGEIYLSFHYSLSCRVPPLSSDPFFVIAMLGTGAFSTVRLAWRKTPEHTHDEDNILPSTSYQDDENNGQKQQSRRSIVRVQSKNSDVDPNASLERKGGELVAVKIIQKSILKQMKTIQKGPNNRLNVVTAFDNIEREIATMKRLKHPNLVRLFEVIDSVESDRMHMVLEYVSLGEIYLSCTHSR